MNTMRNQTYGNRGHQAEAQHEALKELARHSFDLRVHALIMLSIALLAAYCAFCASGAGHQTATNDAALLLSAPDALSIFACLAFVAISTGCLVEAHRFWRKATIIRFRTKAAKPAAAKMGAVSGGLQPIQGF